MTNPETIEITGDKTIIKLCKFGADNGMEGCSFTEIVEKLLGEHKKLQAELNSKTLWAVNIPEEPDSEELLFAATSKEHAQSIVSRLHNEIFETYPTFGEPIADSIYVTEWKEGAEEHAESLTTKWWEVTSFVGSE